MKAYSEDLRAKILEAVDRGMPKSEAAKTFGVSRTSIKRYAAARREGRTLAPRKHPGSKPKLDERARALLESDVEERPAATLKDRRRLLEAMAGEGGTRFLVVTHHPLTMARMHRLYGVTMQERGVSRLLSVDLQRAVEMVEG